ncbi:MAG: gluconeogenesis factor YvcK family protein [Solirubrobacteraceae bacterium]
MRGHIAALGGGHGLASVLTALRDAALELTVVVTIADDGGSSGELRRRWGGPAVGDLRRSLIALTDDEAALSRALGRPLMISRLGTHPLGNLMIHSLAQAFGDLALASRWLGEQLGIEAVVLPASAEPVVLLGDAGAKVLQGESAIGAAPAPVRRLHFFPQRPRVYEAVLAAIGRADWVLLAPGSLFTSTLAAAALPDIAAALACTAAHVVWIANLEPDGDGETGGMSAADHLAALRDHGVRFDAVLYDPAAELGFRSEQIVHDGLSAYAAPLQGDVPGVHDAGLLRAALLELFAGRLAVRPAHLPAAS